MNAEHSSYLGDLAKLVGFSSHEPISLNARKRQKLKKILPHYSQSLQSQERAIANRYRKALHEFAPSGALDALGYLYENLQRRANSYTREKDSTPVIDIELIGGGLSALTLRFDAQPVLPEERLQLVDNKEAGLGPLKSKGIRLIRDAFNGGKIFIEYLKAGEKEYNINGGRRRGGWERLGNNPEYQSWVKMLSTPLTISQQLDRAVYYSEYNIDNRTGSDLAALHGYTTGHHQAHRVVFDDHTHLPKAVRLLKQKV